MEVDDYLCSLRRRWWIPVACAAIAAALALALVGDRAMRTTARVVVGPSATLVGDGGRLSAAESINQDVINTLADVFVSRDVVDEAARRIHLRPDGRDDLEVGSIVGAESRVVDVWVEGPDPALDRRFARAVVAEGRSRFVGLYDVYQVEQIESPGPASSVGPSRASTALLAGVIGLALGVALVLGGEWLAVRARAPRSASTRS